MDDKTIDDRSREGSAEKRADVNDMPNRDSRRTKAGQEATNTDRVPAEHDREDESGYGGGGPNGGKKV